MYKVFCDDYLMYDPRLETLKLFSPKLELELNKTGTFSFLIYPEHPYFDKLQKMKSIIKVYQDDELVFRGRILTDENGFYNEKQVSCEGELAFLNDSIQRPYDFQTGDKHTTIPDFFKYLIAKHNEQVEEEKQFKVGRITVTDPNNYIVRADSTYLNTWETINQKLINTNGGYLWVRHESDGVYIDYLEDFDVAVDQIVEFGENLLSFKRQTNGADIATAIIPIGATVDNVPVTIANLPNETTGEIRKQSDFVYSVSGVLEHGWIFKKEDWNDVTEASNLLAKAKALVATTINQLVTIELTAVDLASVDKNFESFKLGKYVQVYTKPHGINNYFLVKKLSIQFDNPQNNSLTLGTTYSAFTEQTEGSTIDLNELSGSVANLQNSVSNISGSIGNIDQTITGINNSIQGINQTISGIETAITPGVKQNAILGNNWVNYGNDFEEAVYWRNSTATIELSGMISGGTVNANTVLFNLPIGYRPRAIERFQLPTMGGWCLIDILPNGDVTLISGGNAGWISLSGIVFRAS
jgi:phage minor structural protein